mmetsp:Transcript_581/g.687  ORF Transcript_581/g.687 Transcript_581/m.687 type:complete len:216 (-) Transcript_581:4-651(-)
MYNGIGLQTAKGSGTNGYVQRNLANVRHLRLDWKDANKQFKAEPIKVKKANVELLLHEQKRKVELDLLTLEEELRKAGMPEREIQESLADERKQMLVAVEKGSLRYESSIEKKDTHQLAKEKEEEMQKIEKALGISRNAVSNGQCFDQELQAKLRLERMQVRAEQEQARLLAAKKAEKAQQKAEKMRAKADKVKKKAEKKLEKLKKQAEKEKLCL